MLKVDVRFSSELWLIWVSLDSCHAVFVQVLHYLWNSIVVVLVLLLGDIKAFEVFKESSVLLIHVSNAPFCVMIMVFRWIVFRNKVDYIVQAKFLELTVKVKGILNDFELCLKHWH